MKIGILVNTRDHREDVIGITEAAINRGHEVIIFVMDEATKLLEDPAFTALASKDGVSMSFCDHNATKYQVNKDLVPEGVVSGSQYNNAQMQHHADKVIVL